MNFLRKYIDPGLWAALLLSLPIVTPFLNGRLPQTADGMLHVYRMASAALSLQNGIWYPRWSPHLHAGFGYPLHNFYTPLWHLIGGALYVVLDVNAAHVVLAAQAVGVLLGGVGGYLFARTFASGRGALVAAAAFAWTPMRFRELWDQGNVSQLIGMGLIAWCFWGMARLAKQPSPSRLATAALPIGALLLTHHPTAFVALPFVGLYAVLAALLAGGGWRRVALCVVAYGLGVGVAAVYWLPALTEVQYTNLENSISAAYDVRNNFVPLRELLGIPPMLDRAAVNPYRPHNIGAVHVLLAGLGLALALGGGRGRWERGHAVLGGVGLVGCVFLMTAPSLWFWENVPFAERLSFPWRLLGVAAVAVLPGAALFVEWLPMRWRSLAAISAIVLLILSVLPAAYSRGGYFEPLPHPLTAADAQRYEVPGKYGMTGEDEYLPIWTTYADRPIYAPEYAEYENADWFFPYWYDFTPPDAEIVQAAHSDHASGERFLIATEKPFDFQIRQLYFPGWRATLNGESIDVFPQGRLGLATVRLPAGAHTLEIWYGGTRNQEWGMWLSGAGLVVCAGLYALPRRKRTIAKSEKNGRFALAVGLLALAWVGFNQLPPTDFFRQSSSTGQPFGMQHAANVQFYQPNIGYRLELLGYSMGEAQAGGEVELRLYWRALAAFDRVPQVKVLLDSRDRQIVYGQASAANISGIPATDWGTGEDWRYVVQTLRFVIGREVPTGVGVLRVFVYDEQPWLTDAETESAALGEIRIQAPRPALPADLEPIKADFGAGIALEGLTRAIEGETLRLRLYWRVKEEMTEDYTLLLHAWRGGDFVGYDQPPLGINYLTSEWRRGERLVTEVRVPLGAEALHIGFYNPLDGVRLVVSSDELPVQNNALVLGGE